LLLACGWGWTFASHTTATVALQLTPVVFTALYARELRVGQQDITPLTTWSPAALLQSEFPSRKSQPDYSGRTGNDQMASHWFHGRMASRYAGTSLLHTCPLAESYIDRASHEAGAAAEMAASRKDKYVTLALVTSLSQLRLRPWAFSTHQLSTSWPILEEGLARLERPVIYFKEFLFWCSALMLFCCMTVCRPLTDGRTHLCTENLYLPQMVERSENKQK